MPVGRCTCSLPRAVLPRAPCNAQPVSPTLAANPCLPACACHAGLILITHFTLLLGMAAPVWLSNALGSGSGSGGGMPGGAAGQEQQQQEQQPMWLAAYAGIMILGGRGGCRWLLATAAAAAVVPTQA